MEPLNLPRGSVRSILVILLVLLSGLMLFVPTVDNVTEIKAMIVTYAGIAVRDYFTDRKAQNESDGPVMEEPVS